MKEKEEEDTDPGGKAVEKMGKWQGLDRASNWRIFLDGPPGPGHLQPSPSILGGPT